MKMKFLVLGVLVAISHLIGGWKTYKEYLLLDVHPRDSKDVSLLREIMLRNDEIDFWSGPRRNLESCTMMLTNKTLFSGIIQLFKNQDIPFAIRNTDINRMIEDNFEEIFKIRSLSNQSINLDNFNDLRTIFEWLDTLPPKCPRGFLCQVYSIGNSHFGKPIMAFKVSKTGVTRRSWYIDATTHAREWITTGTILKIINHMVEMADENARYLMEKYDWYFVPVVNPDGYEYSWTNDRMWRKNRRQFANCVGVDLNRNFATSNWGKEGTSANPCSQTYAGSSAGSEREAKAISNELNIIGKNTTVLFTLHSYGRMYLIPFGNTINYEGKQCQLTADHDEIMIAVNAAADSTGSTYNKLWKRGNSCQVIYPTTGGTDDYAKEKIGIKYCIVPELRGSSFVISPAEIHPSFVEVFNGIMSLEKNIK